MIPAKTIYQASFRTLVFIIGAGIIILWFWALATIKILPIGVLICFSLMAFLIRKNFPDKDSVDIIKDDIIPNVLFISTIVCGAILLLSDKHEVYLSDVFIDGKVLKDALYIEGDGEMAAQWKTVYTFKAETNIGQTVNDILCWVITGLGILLPILTMNWMNKSRHLVKAINVTSLPIQ